MSLTMQPNTPVRQYRAKTPLAKWALALCALLLAANLAMLWPLFDTAFVRGAGRLPDRAAASWRVGVADMGENPHLTPNYPEAPVDFCDGVSAVDQRAITDGVAYLRATEDGTTSTICWWRRCLYRNAEPRIQLRLCHFSLVTRGGMVEQ